MSLIRTNGHFDLSAIMRAAIALCWIVRTTATGIGSENIQFHTAPVFDRSRMSGSLKAVWRQARRQRQTWRINQPEAVARFEALELANRIRWAAEAASIRAELCTSTVAIVATVAAPLPSPEPVRLAA